MKDLIFSDDFSRYRRRQIRLVAEHIKKNLFTGLNPERLLGSIDMAREMIRLPETIIESKEDKERLNKLVHEDLNGLYAALTKYVIE